MFLDSPHERRWWLHIGVWPNTIFSWNSDQMMQKLIVIQFFITYIFIHVIMFTSYNITSISLKLRPPLSSWLLLQDRHIGSGLVEAVTCFEGVFYNYFSIGILFLQQNCMKLCLWHLESLMISRFSCVRFCINHCCNMSTLLVKKICKYLFHILY